ncbi:hypothetical protein AB0J84_18915 [Micromonospora arborensis]|uniref:hypothetical protein n=1 Tax=Micromonospora arborensis TaxID=2116518 RepID=UPI003436682E
MTNSITVYAVLSAVALVAVIMPIAIIGVDVIPGVCPPWYAVLQVVCMLPIVRVAFLTRGSGLRAAFPRQGRVDPR